ncbi:MAG TPA: hypothetical protein VN953_10865 [Gemmatimonadales bacterium]|nr:hypothetical protein [Gemmatimonadales bacterium]
MATRYVGFTDAASGSGTDSFALAIAHAEGPVAVLDCCRVRHPPFSPDAACADFADVLRSYGLLEVTGDKYSLGWVGERFAMHGIEYRLSPLTRSELYQSLVPLLMARRVELLDLPELRKQFQALERRAHAGGREAIEHMVGAHDDLANVVAGALVLAATGEAEAPFICGTLGGPYYVAGRGVVAGLEGPRPAAPSPIDRTVARRGAWFPGDVTVDGPDDESPGLGRHRTPPELAPEEDDEPTVRRTRDRRRRDRDDDDRDGDDG